MATVTTTIDPFEFLKIVLNPDGSLTRLDPKPTVPSAKPINETPLGFFKDVPLDDAKSMSLRLFFPLKQTPTQKIPVIVFFHGGGFILNSASGKVFHDLCMSMAAQFTAVVVSVDYRLSPEQRLPAAYNDGVDALVWVKQKALNACDFLTSGSAGTNIAYNVGLCALDLDLKPMKIVGLIINQPFIGGVQRTNSELKLINDSILPLVVADLFWSLALPIGANRDHMYSLPYIMIERYDNCQVIWYAAMKGIEMLEACRVDVTPKFCEGSIHAAEVFDPTKVQVLLDDVKAFISSVGTSKSKHKHNDIAPKPQSRL